MMDKFNFGLPCSVRDKQTSGELFIISGGALILFSIKIFLMAVGGWMSVEFRPL